MSKTVYLIDYENVHEAGLQGMNQCPAGDCVHLFYSVNANRLSLDLLRGMKATLTVHKVQPGRQSLDMQLVSYLGYLIGMEGLDCRYVIVSKDTDFTNTPLFWKDELGLDILRRQTIDGSELLPPSPARSNRSGRGRSNNRRSDRDNHPVQLAKEFTQEGTAAGAEAILPDDSLSVNSEEESLPPDETPTLTVTIPADGPALPAEDPLSPLQADPGAESVADEAQPIAATPDTSPIKDTKPLDSAAAEALRYASIASPAKEFGGPSRPSDRPVARPTKSTFVPVPAREFGVAKPKAEEAPIEPAPVEGNQPEKVEAASVPEASATPTAAPSIDKNTPAIANGLEVPATTPEQALNQAEATDKPTSKSRNSRNRRRKAPASEPPQEPLSAPATEITKNTSAPDKVDLEPDDVESAVKEKPTGKSGRKKAAPATAVTEKATEGEGPKAAKAKKAPGAPDKKTQLNNALMKALSDKKVDNDTTMKILGIAMPLFGDTAIKQLTYRGIVKEFGQKKGLELYNIIKPLWNEKKK